MASPLAVGGGLGSGRFVLGLRFRTMVLGSVVRRRLPSLLAYLSGTGGSLWSFDRVLLGGGVGGLLDSGSRGWRLLGRIGRGYLFSGGYLRLSHRRRSSGGGRGPPRPWGGA